MPPRKKLTRPVYDKIVALRKAGESSRAISDRVKLAKGMVDTILSGGYESVEPWAKGVDALIKAEKEVGDAAHAQLFGVASRELAIRELTLTVTDAKAFAEFRNRTIAEWRGIASEQTAAIREAAPLVGSVLKRLGKALDGLEIEELKSLEDAESLMRILSMFYDLVVKQAKLAQIVMDADAPKDEQAASMTQTPADARAFIAAQLGRYQRVFARSPVAAEVEVVG